MTSRASGPSGAFVLDTLDGVMFQDVLLDGVPVEQAWRTAAQQMGDAASAWKAEHPEWTPEIS